MNTKQQIATGAALTIGSLVVFYLYHKLSTRKSSPRSGQRSAARSLLSKYNPRPTEEDIQADNAFQGREVRSHQVSEGGIVYHDIRYPEESNDHVTQEATSEDGEKNTGYDEKCSGKKTEKSSECSPKEEGIKTNSSSEIDDKNKLSEDKDESIVSQEVVYTSPEVSNVPLIAASTVKQNSSSLPSNPTKNESDTAVEVSSSNGTQATGNADGKQTEVVSNGNFTEEVVSNKSVTKSAVSNKSLTETVVSNKNGAEAVSSNRNGTEAVVPNKSVAKAAVSNKSLTEAVVSNGVSGGLVTTEEFVRNVVRAKDKVEMERRRSNQETIEQIFNIPSKAVGKIIGKDGRSIKAIQRESGARLKFPGNRDRSAPFQKLFVFGTLRQVEEAVWRLSNLMPADSVCHDLISWTPDVALSGDLKPVELIENTVCMGRVTHVTSPECVWVQICRGVTGTDYLTQLATLTDNITDTLGRKIYDMRKSLLPVTEIKEGTSCAVLLESRGYRGTVICPGSSENDVHQVRLVDFGTPHSFTELFRLDSYYLAMPALAVKCSLAHITRADGDPVWPEGAAKYLDDLLAECFVKVRVVEADHVPKVELYTELGPNNKNSKYVNRELAYDGYASWVE